MRAGDEVILTEYYNDPEGKKYGQVKWRRRATIIGIYKHFVLVKYKKTKEAFRHHEFLRLIRGTADDS